MQGIWTNRSRFRITTAMTFIEMAPMQGFTDHVFREAFHRFFSGVDATYSPFILLERNGIRPRDRRELAVGLEETGFTPQIAAKSPEEATRLKSILIDEGFDRVNLNLGCPYPMLTKKRRGAGALPHPELVSEILSALFEGAAMTISVKTRLGLTDPNELEAVVPVFNRFTLERVILHPRVATQKYSGLPDWNLFGTLGKAINAKVIANGDINSPIDATRVMTAYPFVAGLMLGRGLLMDPFLPIRIKQAPLPDDPVALMKGFHDAIFEACAARLSPPHLLHRMTAFWSYFAASFNRGKKLYKAVKKAKDLMVYAAVVDGAFSGR